MTYKKYTIKTTPEAEDIICAALAEAGIVSFEIEDGTPFSKEELDEIFTDEVPVRDIPENEAYVSFYLEEDENEKKLLSAALEALEELKGYSDIGEGSVSTSDSEDTDWLNKWKEFFKPFSIDLFDGRRVGIVPSWDSGSDAWDADIALNIDPGTAFGTGAHETTRLCIKELAKYVKDGSRVLDLGTGSGILSMVAFKLGAGSVTATEVDKNAVPAVEDNFSKNGLEAADFRFIIGDVTKDENVRKDVGDNYDIIVANILPVVLLPLTPIIKGFAHEGTVVIYSGILIEKKEPVKEALIKEGFRITDENADGEWCELTAAW